MVKKKSLKNLKPVRPGQVLNPHGRPKLESCFSDVSRALLKSNEIDVTYTIGKKTKKIYARTKENFNLVLACVLIVEGLHGNIKAITELIDRVEGRPLAKVETNQQQITYIISDDFLPSKEGA